MAGIDKQMIYSDFLKKIRLANVASFLSYGLKGSDQRENRRVWSNINTIGTWYGGVVMGVLLTFNDAAIL